MPGGSDKPQQVVYGEMPGLEEGWSKFQDTMSGLLKALQAGTSGVPGYSSLSSMLPGALGTAGKATALAGNILSPGYAEKTSPGLQAIIDTLNTQHAENKQERTGDVLMRYAQAGHSFSSPMAKGLEKAEREADTDLAQRIASLLYQDYGAKRNLQAGLIPGAQQLPLQTGEALGQNAMDILRLFISSILGGRGSSSIIQGKSGGGFDPLNALIGAGLGYATGGPAGAWAGASKGWAG